MDEAQCCISPTAYDVVTGDSRALHLYEKMPDAAYV